MVTLKLLNLRRFNVVQINYKFKWVFIAHLVKSYLHDIDETTISSISKCFPFLLILFDWCFHLQLNPTWMFRFNILLYMFTQMNLRRCLPIHKCWLFKALVALLHLDNFLFFRMIHARSILVAYMILQYCVYSNHLLWMCITWHIIISRYWQKVEID